MHSVGKLSRMLVVAALAATVARTQSAPSPGEWTEKDPPRGWVIVRTASFEVQAEISEPRTQRLAQFLQALRPQFEALWPQELRKGRQVVKVFVSEERRSRYLLDHALGLERRPPGTPPSCARYETFTGDIMAFDSGRLLDVATSVEPVRLESDQIIKTLHADAQQMYPLLDAAAVIYAPDVARDVAREAFRQYHLATSPERSLPLWLEEGVGDWLAAANPGGKPWDLRTADSEDSRRPETGPVNEARLLLARRALVESTVLPAGDVLARSAKERETEPPAILAEGWALVHLLMSSVQPEKKRIVPDLLAAYRASADATTAVDAVLAGVNLGAIDDEWKAFVGSQRPDDPLAELARLYGKGLRANDLVAPDWVRDSYSWHRRHVPAEEAPR